MLAYRIGETTSMGWKVINIEFRHNNKFYSEREFYRIIQNRKQKFIKKQQIKTSFLNGTKSLFYNLIGISILYFIKIMIGI